MTASGKRILGKDWLGGQLVRYQVLTIRKSHALFSSKEEMPETALHYALQNPHYRLLQGFPRFRSHRPGSFNNMQD